VSTVDDAMQSAIRNLEEKTGKSMAEWSAICRSSGLEKHGQLVAFLKAEHGLTHGYANMVALRAREQSSFQVADDDLVSAQYAGAKAALRPVYDALINVVNGFGGDVETAPKKAYVSLRRNKQFAILQPSTAERMDVGINLKGVPPSGRLEASGSFNAMVSHRVRVSGAEDVNDELIGWLRQAYDAA
jgi:hypothetical protein